MLCVVVGKDEGQCTLEAWAALRGPLPCWTGVSWSSWESGFEVALGVPMLTLFSVSSAVRGRGQRTAETPSNPKVTQLGKSHQWGGNHPDAEITPHGLPGRARMSRHRWGIIGLIWKRQGGFSDRPPCFPPHPPAPHNMFPWQRMVKNLEKELALLKQELAIHDSLVRG